MAYDYNDEKRAGNGTWQQIDGEYRYVPPQNARRSRKKRRSGAGALIALMLCCSLLGSVLGAGGILLWQEMKGEPETAAVPILVPAAATAAPAYSSGEMTAAELYEACVNSTVGITTSITTTNYWGFRSQSAASGSGFFLTEDGYILTNYHVIEDSDSVSIALYDGSSYSASIRGYDAGNDIAVLKIDGSGFSPVTLGDSDALRVGDDVVAIGNPLGELTFSLTAGKVSALNRAVTLSSGTRMNLIQTDCAINSGNSGGALFNMRGEVVGITNAKYSGSRSSSSASIDNIGFAIPTSDVVAIVRDIMENGTRTGTASNTESSTQSSGSYYSPWGSLGSLFGFGW